MDKMINGLREYLRTATREQLDANLEDLSKFLSTGPLVIEYLEALPRIEFQTIEYKPVVNPEFSLDFSF